MDDACAADIYWHTSCYTDLKNKARTAKTKAAKAEYPTNNDGSSYDPLVFSQLIAYIRYMPTPVKLIDLQNKYHQKLQHLNSDCKNKNVNPTRFKKNILEKLGEDWHAYKSGRDVYISHKAMIGDALAETARAQVSEDEAHKIVECFMILRKYILLPQPPFDGTFQSNCLSEPVHPALLTAVDVMLEGSNSICTYEDEEENSPELTARVKVANSISQLIISNAIKRASKSN